MKKGVIVLLLITVLFAFLATIGGKESIVICSSAEQFRNDELQEQLNERFPDKNIIVMYMSTGKAAAKVFAEGLGTEIDILVGLETGYMSKIKDHLADISDLSKLPYMDGVTPADNGNKWVTWERQAGAIIVNTDVLAKYGLGAPKTYEDLLKPEYKGLVAMPDPKSSGTGYFFYKSWVNTMGTEGALEFVDKLYGNLKQFTESGSGPIKLLKQGEVAIGMELTDCDILAEGKYADMIMIDLHQTNMQPLHNICKNIVYSGSKMNVKMTMINGKILYEDGKFLCCDDVEGLYAECNAIKERLKDC